MQQPTRPLYTIIEDDSVGKTLAEGVIATNFPNLERIFDAIVWRLSRQPAPPESVAVADTTGVEYRLVRAISVEGAKNPTILVRYRIYKESESIVIDWIKVLPYNPAEAISLKEFEV